MCHSAEASFGSAALLMVAGGWCLRTTAKRAPWLWPIAVVPFLFGVQQMLEGFVWVGLHQQNTTLTLAAAGMYLFFAVAFWPFWFSLAAFLLETDPRRRKFLGLFALLSTGWFFACYVPLFRDFAAPSIHEVGHSIRYDYADSGGIWNHFAKVWVIRSCYLLTTLMPLMIMSARKLFMLPAALASVTAAAAALYFDHAFTSVWCLWGALTSLSVMRIVSLAPACAPGIEQASVSLPGIQALTPANYLS